MTRATLAVVALMLVAGCPPATGRHRGDPSMNGATCIEDASFLTPGGACEIESDQCDTMHTCGIAGTLVASCTCSAGQWVCEDGPCSETTDAGDPICPTNTVHDQDPCTVAQGGLRCAGTVFLCTGMETQVACFCTGTRWSCSESDCDAGPYDASPCPALAEPGAVCNVGTVCDYGADASCGTRCTCDAFRSFACVSRCDDGGTGDTSFDGGNDATVNVEF